MISPRKVYLSKSNHANPDHVMLVRAHLEYLGYTIVEHGGGEYDDSLLYGCKYMIMVGINPPTQAKNGHVMVGKGQYHQLFNRMNKSFSNSMINLYFSHTDGDNNLVPVYRRVLVDGVVDHDNWTTGYGELKVSMSSSLKMSRITPDKHGEKFMDKADVSVEVPKGQGNPGQVFVNMPFPRKTHLACINLLK